MESSEIVKSSSRQIGRARFSSGNILLITLLALGYWLPIGWWPLTYAYTGSLQLPAGFPYLAIFSNTFLISLGAAIAAIVGAYPLVLLWRLSGKLVRYSIVFLMVVPMVMGLLARNYSWIGMLSSHTLAGSLGWSVLGGNAFLFSTLSVYVVMACIFVPVAFFMLVQGTMAVRPEHVEAARTLGLQDWKIVLAVVIPQTYRAALLAFGLIFTMSVGYFVTPRMIGGGKIDFVGNAILTYLNLGKFGEASAIALVFLASVAVPAAVVTVLAMRRRMRVTGR